jgi:hypothetical protein
MEKEEKGEEKDKNGGIKSENRNSWTYRDISNPATWKVAPDKNKFDSLFLGVVVLNKVAGNNKSSQLFLFLSIGSILLTSVIPCIGINKGCIVLDHDLIHCM